MQGYSLSREDYMECLIKKYQENPFYTVTKNKMKEAIYIEWDSCAKCMMMKPHTQKRAEMNWYEFQTFRFDDVSVKEFDIQAVPMLVLKEEWEVKDILDMEWIVNLIVTKK
jgi:hypothetical protein